MNQEAVARALLPALHPVFFDTSDSTNETLRTLAAQGAPAFSCVIAGRQTKGRGRLGRSFFSPEGGLYLSVLLPPGDTPLLLTVTAAVSVQSAIARATGRDTRIKWVNDLLYRGKKVCGILAQGAYCGQTPAGVVLGVGVNVTGQDFPPDVDAISLFDTAPEGAMETLCACVLNAIVTDIERPRADILARYRANCDTLGRDIRFFRNQEWHQGRALDVDERGALLVRTQTGVIALDSGEVTVRAL